MTRAPSRNFMLCLTVAGVFGLLQFDASAFKAEDEIDGHGERVAKPSLSRIEVLARIKAVGSIPNAKVRWNGRRGEPSLVQGADLLQSVGGISSGNVVTDAVRIMSGLADAYGIKDAQAEMVPKRTTTDRAGYSHVRLEQKHNGVSVVGGEMIVHFDKDGKGRAVNGRYVRDLSVDTVPQVSKQTSETVAVKNLAARGVLGGHAVSDRTKLVVFSLGKDTTLAYEVNVDIGSGAARKGEWRYWVDAVTGKVLLGYDNRHRISAPTINGNATNITGSVLSGEGGGVVNFDGWYENTGNYYMWNKTNTWYIFNTEFSGPDANTYAYRTTSDWGTSDRVEVSAASGIDWSLRYFRDVHGRDSFDDAGKYTIANVHVGTDYVNAYWSPADQALFFGDGDGVTANALTVVDVAAHELGHAVMSYTADLIYYGESGALNESFSDIWGVMVEMYSQPDGRGSYPNGTPGSGDWLIGEDCWLSDVALRDMRNPMRFDQPSRYKGTLWYTGAGDNGGVHYNSGVQNFYYYLLCEGGVGNNDGLVYNVSGIGIDQGERLAYLTLVSYMPNNATYDDARDAWLAAAQQADGSSFTTNTVMSVMTAWAACGVGTIEIVVPDEPYIASGEPIIGPYAPSNKVYDVFNFTAAPMAWAITNSQSWLTISPAALTVPAGGQLSVTVSVDQVAAALLPEGTYQDTIAFDDLTTGTASDTRAALLRIGNNYKLRSKQYSWVDPWENSHSKMPGTSDSGIHRYLPFDFSFYGTNYTELYISTDGIIGFSGESLGLTNNVDMPVTNAPNAIISPYWDMLRSGRGSAAIYVGLDGAAPNRRMTITWCEVQQEDEMGVDFTFQAILHEDLLNDGDIIFQYKDVAGDSATVGSGRSATIGVEDQDGTLVRKYSFNGSLPVADEQALLFTRNAFVDAVSPSGTISVADTTDTSVTFGVRFSEIVELLTIGDFSMVTGVGGVAALTGGGEQYYVTVSGISGYGSVVLSLPANVAQDLDGNLNNALGACTYVMPFRTVDMADDMEDDEGEWSENEEDTTLFVRDAWEWGVPSGGPGTAYTGTKCWGTIAAGDYPALMHSSLEAAPVSVGADPILSYACWYFLESSYDYLFVEVDGGSGWEIVETLTGFSGWTVHNVSLANSKFGNRTIKIRFRAVSDLYIEYSGAYIDDVSVASAASPGIWVTSFAPASAAPGSLLALSFTAYNSDTTPYVDVGAKVSSPNSGVSIAGTDVVSYGSMAPGELVVGGNTVTLSLGAAGSFDFPLVSVFHSVTSNVGFVSQEILPFSVTGIAAASLTNRIVATCGDGNEVVNWLGTPLGGDGDDDSCLFQLIYAGVNASNDVPLPNGSVSGDDRLLYTVSGNDTFGRFGEGDRIAADVGRFLKTFKSDVTPGSAIYIRAWDGASFDSSIVYGDSGLRTSQGASCETNAFGSWVVDRPIDYYADWNGDSIPDGWEVENGLDPRTSTGGLANSWTAAAIGGSYGDATNEMSYPGRVVSDGTFVYVADTRNDRIVVWDKDLTAPVSNFGTFGIVDGELNWPQGLCLNAAGDMLIVADTGNGRIVKLDIDTGTGTLTFNSTFGQYGSGNGEFDEAYAVAADAADNIYVVDQKRHNVQVFNSGGTYLSGFGSFGASASQLNRPMGICVTAAGQVYVADSENHRIQIFTTGGATVARFGSYGYDDGEFFRPAGIHVDAVGRIYVADTVNSRVQVFSAAMAHLGTYKPPSGKVGADPGQLYFPQGIFQVVGDETVYIADTWNHRVQRLVIVLDVDGDGMSDTWETAFGLNPNNPADAAIDSDGDGVLNIGEYRAGTDPNVVDIAWITGVSLRAEEPIFRISAVDESMAAGFMAGDKMVRGLSWSGKAGQVYMVQYRDSLVGGDWVDADVIVATEDGVQRWTDHGATGVARYYRLKWIKP